MSSEILRDKTSVSSRMSWRSAPPDSLNTSAHPRANADLEITSRMEQARREGFAAGMAAARQEAEQKILPAIRNIAAAAVELSRLRDALREQATDDLVQLAVSMAARVVHRDVSVDPEALAGLLRAAFLKLRLSEVSRARVHPALEPLLRQCLDQSGPLSSLVLIADPAVKPGDVLFETPESTAEDSVDADLREIERGLADKLEE